MRSPLERCGTVVARGEDTELVRWDQIVPEAPGDVRIALRELVVAGVRSAVVAPERELKRWFSWQWYWDDAILDDERLDRADGFVAIR
ncbi:MAG TPA: hypothetical protein VFM96_14855 [Gaiellaceae bacterium]|nr:hypothetical protein [Gaiellaceae bacterium]